MREMVVFRSGRRQHCSGKSGAGASLRLDFPKSSNSGSRGIIFRYLHTRGAIQHVLLDGFRLLFGYGFMPEDDTINLEELGAA